MSVVDQRYTSGDRIAAAAVLRDTLAQSGHHIPIETAAVAIDAAVTALTAPKGAQATRRCGTRFDPSWTPFDEERHVADQFVDDFAAWYETTFGGDAA